MKPNFGHISTTSFTMWFENHIIRAGEAYNNKTGQLYYTEDDRLPNGFFRYSSPYKQWVTESGLGGSFVPNSIYVNNQEVYRDNGPTGYYIDFANGGVVLTGIDASDSLNITGSFGVKEFNIYNTNETEESLVVEGKFNSNSRFTVPESGIAPYDIVTPAIFINNEYIVNSPYAFGGEDKTTLNFKSVVLAENLYQLDGVLSLFSDTRNAAFEELPFEDYPINEYGDLKTGLFLYDQVADNVRKKAQTAVFNIENVNTSKISETIRNTISPSLYVGFIDFEVSKPRFPRIC